jgi:hypothetical protein
MNYLTKHHHHHHQKVDGPGMESILSQYDSTTIAIGGTIVAIGTILTIATFVFRRK